MASSNASETHEVPLFTLCGYRPGYFRPAVYLPVKNIYFRVGYTDFDNAFDARKLAQAAAARNGMVAQVYDHKYNQILSKDGKLPSEKK